MRDTVEFYKNGQRRPFLIVDSTFQPNDDDLISIKGKTYKVLGRSFAVDYAGEPLKAMRCNVIVEEQS
jgi:hypothetical protein